MSLMLNQSSSQSHHLVLALIALVGFLFFLLSTLIILFFRHQPFRQELRRLCRSTHHPTSSSTDSAKNPHLPSFYTTDLAYHPQSPSYPSPVLEHLVSIQSPPIPLSTRTHNPKQAHRPGTGTSTLRPSTGNTFRSKNSMNDLKQQVINPIIREQNHLSPLDRSITCVEWYSEQIETRPRITSSGSGKIYDILPCPADPLIITTNRPLSLKRLSPVLSSPPTTRFSISTSLEPQPDLDESETSKLDQTLLASDRIDVGILNLNGLMIEEPKEDDLPKEVGKEEEDVDDGISLESDEFYHRRRRNRNNSRPDTANTIVPGT